MRLLASSSAARARKVGEEERLEIHHSVFQAPDGVRPATAETLATPEPGYMSRAEFDTIINSVRVAIEQGVHPRMISQGSSGSYFARNVEGKVVGVFKPKDEEPYAAGNRNGTSGFIGTCSHAALAEPGTYRSRALSSPAAVLTSHPPALFRIFPTFPRPPRTCSTPNYERTWSLTPMS